jgi:periplasmic divalent cation tolerance protein
LSDAPAVAAVLLSTTVDSEAAAVAIATEVVTDRLAACVQVIGPVTSVYRWQGQVEQAREWACQMKTTAARLDLLTSRLRGLHPYQVPEILAVPILTADPAYLSWLADSVAPEP